MSKTLKGTGWMIGLTKLEMMRKIARFKKFEDNKSLLMDRRHYSQISVKSLNGNGYKQPQVNS
jgi:hypothetical protein